jgi:DNA-binding MarR family transcriptional regulator
LPLAALQLDKASAKQACGGGVAEAAKMAEMLDRLARMAHGAQFCAGLNPAQWAALRYLKRANRYSRTPGALAEYCGATPGTISQTLIALETKGYVSRRRSDTDGRSTTLALTSKGEALLADDPLTRLGEAVETLPKDERAALDRAIDRVVAKVSAERGGCGFGLCHDCSHLQRPERKSGSCRCGVTGDALATGELDQICVDFQRQGL